MSAPDPLSRLTAHPPAQIVVIGAGYTGALLLERAKALLPHTALLAASRHPEALRERLGARVTCLGLDLLEPTQLEAALAPHLRPGAWIVYSAPTLFSTHEPADPSQDELARHVLPVARVEEVAAAAHAAGLVYLSSTSVYGDHQGEWIDEEAALRPTAAPGKMRRDIERFLLDLSEDDTHLPKIFVARLVGIYGPGRTLADYIAAGRYKVVDGGRKITNRVHVEDIVSAVFAMIASEEEGRVRRAYNVSDGHPRAVRELLTLLSHRYGVRLPPEVSLEEYAEERGEAVAARWQNSYRCDSTRLRTELGWQPRHEDALEGLKAVLDGELPIVNPQ